MTCVLRRLGTAWVSTQSDQSVRCALSGKLRAQDFFMWTARLMRMPKLIWVFAGCTGHFVGFVMLGFNYNMSVSMARWQSHMFHLAGPTSYKIDLTVWENRKRNDCTWADRNYLLTIVFFMFTQPRFHPIWGLYRESLPQKTECHTFKCPWKPALPAPKIGFSGSVITTGSRGLHHWSLQLLCNYDRLVFNLLLEHKKWPFNWATINLMFMQTPCVS